MWWKHSLGSLNSMKKIVIFLVLLTSGCAGSPVATSRLNPEKIQLVDNYTLCRAYTARELYSPSSSVINEVFRRGLNCSTIYQYVPTPIIIQNAPTAQTYTPQSSSSQSQQQGSRGFYKSEIISGNNKICFYDKLGSVVSKNISAAGTCPLLD